MFSVFQDKQIPRKFIEMKQSAKEKLRILNFNRHLRIVVNTTDPHVRNEGCGRQMAQQKSKSHF